jgi:hypothetical protein
MQRLRAAARGGADNDHAHVSNGHANNGASNGHAAGRRPTQ